MENNTKKTVTSTSGNKPVGISKKKKVLMSTLIPIATLAVTAAIVAPTVIACNNKSGKVDVELIESSEGVTIKESDIQEGKDSTVTLSMPKDKEVDTDQLEVKVDGKKLNKDEYTIDGNKITIKASAMKGKKVTIKVITKQAVEQLKKIEVVEPTKSYKVNDVITEKDITVKAIYKLAGEKTISWGSEATNYKIYAGKDIKGEEISDFKDGYTLKDAGTAQFTVAFEDKTHTFTINVDDVLKSIAVEDVTKTYKVDGKISASDIKVTATWEVSARSEISWGSKGYSIYAGIKAEGTPIADFDKGYTLPTTGNLEFTVKYKDQVSTFKIVVNDKVTGLTATPKSGKTFSLAAPITKDDIIVTATYKVGTPQTIEWGTSGYSIYAGEDTKTGTLIEDFETGYSFTKTGKQKFTVSYAGFSSTFEIDVQDVLTDVTATVKSGTTFEINGSIKSGDIEVKAKYQSSSEKTLTWGTGADNYQIYYGESATGAPISDFTKTGYTFATTGEHKFTVKFGEKTSTFNVNVSDKIKAIKATDKSGTTFKFGDVIKAKDIKVEAEYESGATATEISWGTTGYQIYFGQQTTTPITDFGTDGYTFNNVGDNTFTIKYGSYTTELTINVEDAVESLTIDSSAIPSPAGIGTTITDESIVVTANYKSGGDPKLLEWGENGYKIYEGTGVSKTEITDFGTNGYTFNKLDTNTFTVEFGGVIETFSVEVVDVVTNLDVDDLTSSYVCGHKMKPSDIKVTATWQVSPQSEISWGNKGYTIYAGTGDTKIEITDFGTNGYELKTAGEHIFTVEFGGKSELLTIHVDDVITSLGIEMVTTSYHYGDKIKASCIKVTANYASGATPKVLDYDTDKYKVYEGEGTTGTEIEDFKTGKQLTEAGEQKFTVEYDDLTSTFTINVQDTLTGLTAEVDEGTTFSVNDYIKSEHVTVTAIYNGGAKTEEVYWTNDPSVNDGYEMYTDNLLTTKIENFMTLGYQLTKSGDTYLYARYGDLTATMKVTVQGETSVVISRVEYLGPTTSKVSPLVLKTSYLDIYIKEGESESILTDFSNCEFYVKNEDEEYTKITDDVKEGTYKLEANTYNFKVEYTPSGSAAAAAKEFSVSISSTESLAKWTTASSNFKFDITSASHKSVKTNNASTTVFKCFYAVVNGEIVDVISSIRDSTLDNNMFTKDENKGIWIINNSTGLTRADFGYTTFTFSESFAGSIIMGGTIPS